jgi:hypothetical protein
LNIARKDYTSLEAEESRLNYIVKFGGLILELLAFITLPFTTYVLLSSLHIVWQIIRQERTRGIPLTIGEISGTLFILFGCLIVAAFGGDIW